MGMFAGDFSLKYNGHSSYEYEPGQPPLSYYSDSGQMIELPERFTTDLASTPRFLWILPQYAPDSYAKAALVHDYLFERHHQGRDLLNFSEANALLEEMARAEGANRWVAWSYRVACNLGGGRIWNRKKFGSNIFPTATVSQSILQRFVPYLEHERWEELNELLRVTPIRHMAAVEQVTLGSLLCHDDILEHLPILQKEMRSQVDRPEMTLVNEKDNGEE